MTPYERLRWEAERLGVGTHRIACPWCLGGSSAERSLSLGVGVGGALFYRCFRSSCGKYGGAKNVTGPSRVKAPRYFTSKTENLDDERKLWFHERFGFIPQDVRYAPGQDRYVYAVRGPVNYKLRGFVARSFSGEEPKVLTYNEAPDEPFIGWSLSPLYSANTGPIVVVEDWVSSEKVAQAGGVGVSLNGTYLSLDAAMEIAECTLDRQVVFALDRDAYAKSVGLVSQFGGLFKRRPRVWRLFQDLKYEAEAAIRKAMLDDSCNDFGDEWARSANPASVH